jgi:hypothetical protein
MPLCCGGRSVEILRIARHCIIPELVFLRVDDSHSRDMTRAFTANSMLKQMICFSY